MTENIKQISDRVEDDETKRHPRHAELVEVLTGDLMMLRRILSEPLIRGNKNE